MIHNNSVILIEADADEFLESIGVALYENYITIGEHSIPCIEGQSILGENDIFLCKDGIILEGEQAEAYKAKKAKEKEEESKKYDKYDINGFIDSAPKFMKGSRANNSVGNQASLKQIDIKDIKGSTKKYDYTRSSDSVRRKYASDIVERDRLNRQPQYTGKGITIRTSDGKPNSWSLERDYKGAINQNPYYDKHFDDKNKRIAYAAAMDAANRHLRRHTKMVKESCGIFSSVAFI